MALLMFRTFGVIIVSFIVLIMEVTAIMKKLLTLMLLVSLCLSGCALGNNVSDILKIC